MTRRFLQLDPLRALRAIDGYPDLDLAEMPGPPSEARERDVVRPAVSGVEAREGETAAPIDHAGELRATFGSETTQESEGLGAVTSFPSEPPISGVHDRTRLLDFDATEDRQTYLFDLRVETYLRKSAAGSRAHLLTPRKKR